MLLENELGAPRAGFARGAFYFGFAMHIGESRPRSSEGAAPFEFKGTGFAFLWLSDYVVGKPGDRNV